MVGVIKKFLIVARLTMSVICDENQIIATGHQITIAGKNPYFWWSRPLSA